MEIIEYPSRDDWNKITERPHLDTLALHEKVRNILKEFPEGLFGEHRNSNLLLESASARSLSGSKSKSLLSRTGRYSTLLMSAQTLYIP